MLLVVDEYTHNAHSMRQGKMQSYCIMLGDVMKNEVIRVTMTKMAPSQRKLIIVVAVAQWREL